MGRAAIANVCQFVIPGSGDVDRFYNLPGRAVFDPLTALLAILGLMLLLMALARSEALFLLLWFPALLLPSFLATDRWPTLPRVLGVIPGVYFFPAVGLAGLLGFLSWLGRRVRLRGLAQIVALIVAVAALGSHAAHNLPRLFSHLGSVRSHIRRVRRRHDRRMALAGAAPHLRAHLPVVGHLSSSDVHAAATTTRPCRPTSSGSILS